MLRHMLVRLEDSTEGLVAKNYVLQLAKGYRGTVTGLFVRPPPPIEIPADATGVSVAALATAHVPVGTRHEWEVEQHGLQTRLFEGFLASGLAADVTVRTEVRTGWAAEEIALVARTADLVALARSPVEGGRLGSLLEGLVRHIPHPFLVAGETAELKRIAIAYDGSPGACRALATAADLVSHWTLGRPEVTVLEVVPRGGVPLGDLTEAQHYLSIYGISARGMLVNGTPSTAIADVADGEGIDLVCMGAYGHWVLRDILIGSTTQAVIERRAKPLLLCH